MARARQRRQRCASLRGGVLPSSFARTEAAVGQGANGVVATAEMEGAVVTMGGGVFFGNRIDDAFAVVEIGVPGVEVFHENRPAGMTNSSGRALIPGLRSYQRNKIAIDTSKLPVDADVSTTEGHVTPADRSGVRLNFAVRTDVKPAIVSSRVRTASRCLSAHAGRSRAARTSSSAMRPRLHQECQCRKQGDHCDGRSRMPCFVQLRSASE